MHAPGALEEVQYDLLRPIRSHFLYRYRHVYIYMSPGSDLTLSIVCGWLARAISFKQTESESNGYIMNVSM